MLIGINYLSLIPVIFLWYYSYSLLENWNNLNNFPEWGNNPYLMLIVTTFYILSIYKIISDNWISEKNNQWFLLLIYSIFIFMSGLIYSFIKEDFTQSGFYFSSIMIIFSSILLLFFTDFKNKRKYFNSTISLVSIIYLTLWINNLH